MIFILNFAAIARRHSLFDIECLLLISVQPWSPGRLAAYFIISSAGITRPTLRLGIIKTSFAYASGLQFILQGSRLSPLPHPHYPGARCVWYLLVRLPTGGVP